jgi:hypothetical protein
VSALWFFSTTKDGTVYLQARLEGDGGMIGDAVRTVREGERFCGLTHAELKKVGAGIVEVDDNGARIKRS